jgi:hypothetical protein
MILEASRNDTQRASPSWRWRLVRKHASILAFALVLAPTSWAGAQPIDVASRKAAGALGAAGLDAYLAGQYEQARDKLDKAYAIATVPTLGLWSGRALRQLGLWLEAEARFRETIGLGIPDVAPDQVELQKQAVAEARGELGSLTPAIPRVVIELAGARWADANVSLDGQSVSGDEPEKRLNPGAHHLEGHVGVQRQEVNLRLKSGDARTVVLHFRDVAPMAADSNIDGRVNATDWRQIAGWSALGVGGAGLILGTVTGIVAMNEKGDIDDSANCVDNRCSPAENGLVDRYNSHRSLSSFGFIAGGVLAATGITILVLAGSSESPRAEAFVSPQLAGVRGAF